MRGRRVERRFGWDCHGLPVEVEYLPRRNSASPGRGPSIDYGVDRFNDACRSLVAARTPTSGERYVTRQARWVDFDNDYKTMDLSYMESVMWAFKQLYDRGLVYEGNRVLPYCWECETPLSNFETRQDDAYQDRHDPAVTVLFDLDRRPTGLARAGEDPGVDDDAVDPAVEPGPRRRPRHRLRRLRRRRRPRTCSAPTPPPGTTESWPTPPWWATSRA